MNQKPGVWIAAMIVALAQVPFLWMFSLAGMPSLQSTRSTGAADVLGVWVFTWAMIWIASLAALVVAWLCGAGAIERLRKPRHA